MNSPVSAFQAKARATVPVLEPDPAQAVDVGPGPVPSRLGGERGAVARLDRGATNALVVTSVRVGKQAGHAATDGPRGRAEIRSDPPREPVVELGQRRVAA